MGRTTFSFALHWPMLSLVQVPKADWQVPWDEVLREPRQLRQTDGSLGTRFFVSRDTWGRQTGPLGRGSSWAATLGQIDRSLGTRFFVSRDTWSRLTEPLDHSRFLVNRPKTLDLKRPRYLVLPLCDKRGSITQSSLDFPIEPPFSNRVSIFQSSLDFSIEPRFFNRGSYREKKKEKRTEER